jgi:lysozyme family protein
MGRPDAHGEALYRNAFLNESQRLEIRHDDSAALMRPATTGPPPWKQGAGAAFIVSGVKQEGDVSHPAALSLPAAPWTDLIGLWTPPPFA